MMVCPCQFFKQRHPTCKDLKCPLSCSAVLQWVWRGLSGVCRIIYRPGGHRTTSSSADCMLLLLGCIAGVHGDITGGTGQPRMTVRYLIGLGYG
jgi:hypothetical protein